MNIGEISNAVPFLDEEGYSAFRLLFLKDKTTPHKANLNDDYDRIKNWSLENKQHKAIVDWVKEKTKKTYINIIERYRDCEFETRWIF